MTVDIAHAKELIAKWDEDMKEQKEIEACARRRQTEIQNQKLVLAKALRGIADQIDPPKRNTREGVF